MQFHVLGALEVLGGAGPVAVRRGRPRSLLHLLLLHRRVVVPVEVVADRLWPEAQPADAGNAVHQLVSYLRRQFGDEGRHCLVTNPTGYMLDVADDDLDAHVFEALVHSALGALASPGRDAPAQALAAAEQAALLWRGEPFAESATYEWVAGDVQRLKDTYLLLQEARLEALLGSGRHREALLEATSLVSAYPLREQLHGHLSLALYRSGRQGEALEVHRHLRALLDDELGIDPSAPMQALEERILRQDPSLDWRPPAGEPVAPRAPREIPTRSAAPEQPPPPYVTPLRGRETDLEHLGELLAGHRLVTIVGPPGVGKSRLAAAVTDAAQRRWFLDLGDAEPRDVTPGTVASRLHLDDVRDDPSGRIADALDGPGVLVLDGCEAATSSVRSLVSQVLRRTRDLRVVVSSRRPLQLAGEVVYRLGTLDSRGTEPDTIGPAVQVFLDSAPASTGRPCDGTADLAQVEAIVSALDGLPLAIELAAANVDVLGLPALLDHVTAQLDYLVQPGPDAPARHQSLRAAISASVDLLDEAERWALAQLSVFPGTFDLEAAAAVTDASPARAYQHVASLVRQSLLVTDGGSGYRLLAPIRDYASELFNGVEGGDTVRDRHARYVAGLVAPAANEMHLQTQKDAVRRLQQSLGDARAALQWSLERHDVATAADIASAYAWFWNLLGMTEEGIEHLLEVRRSADESGHDWGAGPAYATLLRNIGLLANPVGRLALAEEACTTAADLCRRLHDWDGAARALCTLGIALWARGAYDQAARVHDEAVALHARGASDWARVSALVLRARTALDAGEPDAEARIDQAVAAARQAGDTHMRGLAALVQARWAYLSGRHELAEVAASQALDEWRLIAYREGEIGALNLLGRLALATRRSRDAQHRFTEALRIATAAGHPGGQCEAVESLSALAAHACRFEHAYFLSCVAALERRRIGAAVPAADLDRLRALEETCTEVLGPTAELVKSRAQVVDFADVRRELLLS